MKIASEHAETVGERAGIGVEEWLLLNGVALGAANVSPRHVERSTTVIADLADTCLSLRDRAAVSAGVTAEPIVLQFGVKARVGLSDLLIKDGAERSHDYSYFSAARTLTGSACFSGSSAVWTFGTFSRRHPETRRSSAE